MSSLIGFEIKKFFHRKKNLIAIIMFLILSIIYITLNINLEKSIEESKRNLINSDIESVEVALKGVELELVSQSDNEKLKGIKYSYEKDLNMLKGKREGLINGDNKKYLINTIEYDKKIVREVESGNIIYGGDLNELKSEIQINQILLEKDIKPINTGYSMEGFNFIRLFLNSPVSILIAILIILLSGDVVSSEYDDNTYKLLFTQAISRYKIIAAKIISSITLVLGTMMGILILLFMVLGFTKGFGTTNYPVNFYDGTLTTISMGEFILYDVLLLILVIVFLTTLSVLMSLLTKNTTSSISISVILVVAIYMISSKGLIKSIAHFNPFVYLDISNVIQGGLATSLSNSNVNMYTGIILLSFMSILIFIITIVLFKNKKDSV